MIRPPQRTKRHGIAAVEMAVISIPLLILTMGVLEVGRAVQVTQIVASAAREGLRYAAVGQVIIPVAGGFQRTEVYRYPGTPPNGGPANVYQRVKDFLTDNGLDPSSVAQATLMTYTNSGQPTPPPPPNPPRVPAKDPTEPWGATRYDRLTVRVQLPYNAATKSRITPLALLNITMLQATAEGFCLLDADFNVVVDPPGWVP